MPLINISISQVQGLVYGGHVEPSGTPGIGWHMASAISAFNHGNPDINALFTPRSHLASSGLSFIPLFFKNCADVIIKKGFPLTRS